MAGNRLTKTTSAGTMYCNWDALNRLKSTSMDLASGKYTYRPDGLISMKVVVSGYGDFNENEDNPTYYYRYDGQMQFEEEALVDKRRGTAPYRDDVTRHTLGARGIDMIEAERVHVPSLLCGEGRTKSGVGCSPHPSAPHPLPPLPAEQGEGVRRCSGILLGCILSMTGTGTWS